MSFDINKPYRTRDGRKAWAFQTPFNFLIGVIEGCGDQGYSWFSNGGSRHGDDRLDLVNTPEKRTVKVWINCYDGHGAENTAYAYPTRERADGMASDNREACIEREITYEVGEGL
jgi:hypothetical protein